MTATGLAIPLSIFFFSVSRDEPHYVPLAVLAGVIVVAIIGTLFLRPLRPSKKAHYIELAKNIAAACQPANRDQAIVDREADVAVLADLLSGPNRAHDQIVVLVGPSGAGKSSLIGASNGLIAKLRTLRWQELDAAESIAGQRIHARARAFVRVEADENRFLVVYDQVEQFLLSAELTDTTTTLYRCFSEQLRDEQVQHLLAIRDDMLAPLVQLVASIRKRSVERFHFVSGLSENGARELLQSMIPKTPNSDGASQRMAIDAVIAEAAQASRAQLPIELKLRNVVSRDGSPVGEFDSVEERTFKALVHSQDNAVLAAQILVLLADEVRGRHATTTDTICDALPYHNRAEVEAQLKSYLSHGVVHDRGEGQLELTCDLLSRIVQSRADSVLLGSTVRNLHLLSRDLKEARFAAGWKKVASSIRTGTPWRITAYFMFSATLVAMLYRILVPPDRNFLPTFFAVISTGLVTTSYQSWVSRVLPVKSALRRTFLLTFTIANAVSVAAIYWSPRTIWPFCVGALAVITAIMNTFLYRGTTAPSSQKPLTNWLFAAAMLLPGVVLYREAAHLSEVKVTFTALLVAWMGRTWIVTLGEIGATEMVTQVMRGLAARMPPR